MKNPAPETWIGWVGALVVVVAITITFAYGNFETIEHAKERADTIVKRLDTIADDLHRMDEKIDRVIERRGR